MAKMPSTAKSYKRDYCQGKHFDCARNLLIRMLEEANYQIDERIERKIETMSVYLAPNDHEKVKALFAF